MQHSLRVNNTDTTLVLSREFNVLIAASIKVRPEAYLWYLITTQHTRRGTNGAPTNRPAPGINMPVYAYVIDEINNRREDIRCREGHTLNLWAQSLESETAGHTEWWLHVCWRHHQRKFCLLSRKTKKPPKSKVYCKRISRTRRYFYLFIALTIARTVSGSLLRALSRTVYWKPDDRHTGVGRGIYVWPCPPKMLAKLEYVSSPPSAHQVMTVSAIWLGYRNVGSGVNIKSS